MFIQLKRISLTDKGVFGVLMKDDMPLCVTLELPEVEQKECFLHPYRNI